MESDLEFVTQIYDGCIDKILIKENIKKNNADSIDFENTEKLFDYPKQNELMKT